MLIALQILGGFALLIVGSEVLVRGASNLAALLGMTPLVIGLTVVAFGTSSPELAVSIQSVFEGKADLAVGNAVGSNILNVLLVLGLSSLVVPLTVKSQVVKFDVPLMIGATLALLLVTLDGSLSRIEGISFVAVLIAYITILIRKARRETKQEKADAMSKLPESEAMALMEADVANPKATGIYFALLVGGLIILGVGCSLFVDGSVALAKVIGVSELVIGLTVMSVGTSLPELVTTVVAVLRGERDMAVGNIVGSNMFNILCVLGITSSIAPDSIPVKAEVLHLHLPVALASAVICLPIFFTKWEISRWEGALMLVLYSAYMTYMLMQAYESTSIDTFTKVACYGLLPLTVLILAGSTVMSIGNSKLKAEANS